MTQQTNGMPELKYSEETFREMYEALKSITEEGTRCMELYQPIREIYQIDKVDRLARQALAKAEEVK